MQIFARNGLHLKFNLSEFTVRRLNLSLHSLIFNLKLAFNGVFMRKFYAILLAALVALSIATCGGKGKERPLPAGSVVVALGDSITRWEYK